MKQILFSIGPLNVYSYGLMTALGVLGALFVLEQLTKREELKWDKSIDYVFFCLIFGYAGSRIIFFLTVLDEVVKNPKMLIDFTYGYVVYGGIIGGIFGAFVFSKVYKADFFKWLDCALIAVPLAQALGRIGCFMSGCCYGKETDHFPYVVFPAASNAPAGVKLVPSQLYSSLGDFIIFGVLLLIFFKFKKERKGVISAAYLIMYSIGRFLIEFVRGDVQRGFVGVLSTSQFIAIIIFVVGVLGLLWRLGIFTNVNASNSSSVQK